MHDPNNAGLSFENARFTVDGIRIFNVGDGIRPRGGAVDFLIKDAWLSYVRDDCVENDHMNAGMIEDSLFDGCFAGFSSRNSDASQTGPDNLVVIQNSLVRLEAMPGPPEGGESGHKGFFKWASWGDPNSPSPKLALYNNIFMAEQQGQVSDEKMGVPPGKLESCADNIMVWLGPGNYPAILPACFTVTTDRSVWDEAVSEWVRRHTEVCTSDAECDDGDPCTVDDRCVNGECESASRCGNGVVDAACGETCDGADATACGAGCVAPGEPGECTCISIAICGDDELNLPDEECDGTADTACPGRCLADCRCGAGGVLEADVWVSEKDPTLNYGSSTELWVDASAAKHTFLRVRVTGIDGRPVESALLELQVALADNAASDAGGRIHVVDDCAWDEHTMTWETQPAMAAEVLDTVDSVQHGDIVNFDVTSVVQGDGLHCFGLDSPSTDGVIYNARDAAAGGPRLVVTLAAAACTDDADCDDGNPCTQGICDPAVGTCQYAARGDGTSCGADGLCCAGGCILPACGSNAPCDDGNSCTVDSCTSGDTCAAACSFTPAADGTACAGGLCCAGSCTPPACSTDADCADGDPCTIDACTNGGTCAAACSATLAADGTACAGGLCCAGSCTPPACSTDADCGDSDACTIDACQAPGTCAAACANTPPACGAADSCCAPECDGTSDPDCPTCTVTPGEFKLEDRRVKWKLSNDGDELVTVERIDVAWPAQFGNLKKIKLDGDIFKNDERPPPSVVLTAADFEADRSRRQLERGETKDLVVEFTRRHKQAKQSDMAITVYFEEGCSVVLP
jgi:hypothetical protein